MGMFKSRTTEPKELADQQTKENRLLNSCSQMKEVEPRDLSQGGESLAITPARHRPSPHTNDIAESPMCYTVRSNHGDKYLTYIVNGKNHLGKGQFMFNFLSKHPIPQLTPGLAIRSPIHCNWSTPSFSRYNRTEAGVKSGP